MSHISTVSGCYIEDIWIFQCKIEFYFTEWTPNAVFSRVAVATSEKTNFGVHEWIQISINMHSDQLEILRE